MIETFFTRQNWGTPLGVTPENEFGVKGGKPTRRSVL
jgi:hypothetical protein